MNKDKALEDYTDMQKELENEILDVLIVSYQTTGAHPCNVDVDIFYESVEENHFFHITDGIKDQFQQFLDAEILRAGDYDQ